ETMKSRLDPNLFRTCTDNRSAVHNDSPASRNWASLSAAERAALRLSANRVISFAKGRRTPKFVMARVLTDPSVRKVRIHCAARDKGPAMLQRTNSTEKSTEKHTFN